MQFRQSHACRVTAADRQWWC